MILHCAMRNVSVDGVSKEDVIHLPVAVRKWLSGGKVSSVSTTIFVALSKKVGGEVVRTGGVSSVKDDSICSNASCVHAAAKMRVVVHKDSSAIK